MLVKSDQDLADRGWLERCTSIVYQLPSRRQRYAFGLTLAAILLDRHVKIETLDLAMENMDNEGAFRLTENQAVDLTPWLWHAREVGGGVVLCSPLDETGRQELEHLHDLHAVLEPYFADAKTLTRTLRRKTRFTQAEQDAWWTMLDWQRCTFLREIEEAESAWVTWLLQHPEMGGAGLQEMVSDPMSPLYYDESGHAQAGRSG